MWKEDKIRLDETYREAVDNFFKSEDTLKKLLSSLLCRVYNYGLDNIPLYDIPKINLAGEWIRPKELKFNSFPYSWDSISYKVDVIHESGQYPLHYILGYIDFRSLINMTRSVTGLLMKYGLWDAPVKIEIGDKLYNKFEFQVIADKVAEGHLTGKFITRDGTELESEYLFRDTRLGYPYRILLSDDKAYFYSDRGECDFEGDGKDIIKFMED